MRTKLLDLGRFDGVGGTGPVTDPTILDPSPSAQDDYVGAQDDFVPSP